MGIEKGDSNNVMSPINKTAIVVIYTVDRVNPQNIVFMK